jgi:hypothetical protein
MTFDENLINHYLLATLYNKTVYSFTEIVLKYVPPTFLAYAKMAANLAQTSIMGQYFPKLVQELGLNQKMDFRCGFDKNFLTKSNQDEIKIS